MNQPRLDDHWSGVYSARPADCLSWYQAEPALSLALMRRASPPPARVLDVGGGASRLVDFLLEAGYTAGVLDISDVPLAIARRRLGPAADHVEWITADVRSFASSRPWDVWHDRAVFHFLTSADDRAAYRDAMLASTAAGATIVMATFGPDGPQRCSGLPVVRYGAEQLAAELGPMFELLEATGERHVTPAGSDQQFVYCSFRRS